MFPGALMRGRPRDGRRPGKQRGEGEDEGGCPGSSFFSLLFGEEEEDLAACLAVALHTNTR